ncbi:hypothetical protein BJY01DRAFT_247849 [Aspergillus pseudoustus]|uniref:ubiquitinyl hydrolase 1 n=1 Tax=Aspergillus pseudoustus TaxID=1810923 RepID=A0ABR4JY83_9EURO
MTLSNPPRCTPQEATRFLFHHIFLPLKLPQSDDYDPGHDIILLEKVIDALRSFSCHFGNESKDVFDTITTMIVRLKKTYGFQGEVSENELLKAFEILGKDGKHAFETANGMKSHRVSGGFLPVHVREQNAGVILGKYGNAIHVEAFELSPRNEAVTTTTGRLIRDFPGPAIAMDVAIFNEPGLRRTLAQTLAKMSHQPFPGTKPKVRKAKQKHDEDRDTTHPKMVTEFLMAALHPLCSSINTLQIRKNTREEVNWHNSRSPWRRSALWLFLRVILQLVFRKLSAGECVDDFYKQFMVYFMTYLLQTSAEDMSSEEVYLMNAKVVRRLLKLDLPKEPSWFPSVQQTLSRATHIIQCRWTNIMTKNLCDSDKLSLANLDFAPDIQCTFPSLDQLINEIKNRKSGRSTAVAFQPKPQLLEYLSSDLPMGPDTSSGDYQTYNLAAFEEWVALHLDAWMEHHQQEQFTCNRLGRLITQYYHSASTLYKENPEALSVMLLTVLELWVACDKSAVLAHNMLSEYDSCVPLDCFQPLLLPFKSQILRLAQAEAYLQRRQITVRNRGSGIFCDFGTPTCFSVRFFNQSEEHQLLHERIIERASQDRAQKKQELQQKQQKYRQLEALARQTECQYVEVIVDQEFGFTETRHSSSCTRCSYEAQAKSITIDCHEWPLSSDDLKAKSTVFELRVVEPFKSWRDTTLFLLLDVFKFKYTNIQRPRAECRPCGYRGLSAFITVVEGNQRIGLLSQDKPHTRTHRKNKAIVSVTEPDICLNNGLNFKYFDNTIGCFLADFETSLETTTLCTYRLPEQSSSLQQFLFRPPREPNGLSPNTAIASQFGAPTHIPLEEYRALTVLPLGLEIQWQNILLELSVPSVDFKKSETEIFIRQIIHQAGPQQPGTCLRQGHAILDDSGFTATLLGRIEEVAERIRENWEMIQGLSSLIALVLRVLSLSSSTHIRSLCVSQLKGLRQTALRWVRIIRERGSEANNDAQRNALISKSVHVALVCTETFNVEDLKSMLSVPSDLAIFVQCCMIIWNGRRSLSFENTPLFKILYHRYQILNYRCHSVLTDEVVHHRNPGLDQATQEFWAAYRPGSYWSKASDESGYWLMTRFTPDLTNEDMVVHYNLLTGEFLVDGLPLARLPLHYEGHKTYSTLFGKTQLEVMPSSSPGMQFSCQKQYMGHVVHLGQHKAPTSCGFDLSVEAAMGNSVWEVVPSRIFAGCFPDAFVEDCVHWYAADGDYVEFRPANNPWLSSTQNWFLRRNSSKTGWYLEKQGSYLVNVTSPTAKSMAEIFEPIEKPLGLHCILDGEFKTLNVEMPRLRLEFSLHSQCSVIRCRQYPGMSVNGTQLLRCLTGLRNKIVLTNHDSKDQVVLIPEGDVSWAKDGDHVDVTVKWQPETKLHAYTVDHDLGWLVDDGSLQSKLFLAYLHALTSFCLPDPLTKKTGTEQALSILRSASIRSFDQLQRDHIELLGRIASITPKRIYYPANVKEMQEIWWHSGLGSLSQHNGFFESVANIFDQDRRKRFLYAGDQKSYPLPHIEKDLLKRDNMRNSSFRVSGYGAEAHNPEYDDLYEGLDSCRASPGACRVYSLCKMLLNDIPSIQQTSTEQLTAHLWKFLSRSNAIRGSEAHFDLAEIGYGAEWTMKSSDFVTINWCSIHSLVSSRNNRFDIYRLMIWLSTMAFSGTMDMIVLETIASLFVIPGMALISSPNRAQFQPAAGFEVDLVKTGALVRKAYRQLSQTPEGLLKPTATETLKQFKARKERLLNSNRTKVCKQTLQHLESQWPTRSPSWPFSDANPKPDEYINVQKFMAGVQDSFKSWYDNREFRQYVADIAAHISLQTVQDVGNLHYLHPSRVHRVPQRRGFLSFDDFLGLPPVLNTTAPQLPKIFLDAPLKKSLPADLLRLVDNLGLQAKSNHEKWYVKQLRSSADFLLGAQEEKRLGQDVKNLEENLRGYLSQCQIFTEKMLKLIVSQMCHGQAADQATPNSLFRAKVINVVVEIKQCPRFSPALFLEQLSRHRWNQLQTNWKRCFVAHGCAITKSQWAKRLVGRMKHHDDLVKELCNPGHTNWDPFECPESLLLEIESGLLIREVQEDIAQYMTNPVLGENAVMQLNMGEGKSSVIVPIVATRLANGSCLVKIIVAKPQSRQMFEMLISKLGGLLNRQVYHLPVSRSLKLDQAEADEIGRMCRECMLQGGVMLVQPEHILSLKLMCLESFIVGKPAVGRSLLETLQFFESCSRDVVDESDENFNVKFELVYTMGAQRPVELSPQRWTMIQQILGLVRQFAPVVKREFPGSIEVEEQKSGVFPRIRLLQRDAEERLFNLITTYICDSGIDYLPIARQPRRVREAVRTYVLNPNLTPDEVAFVEDNGPAGFWTENTRSPLLLLRGLFAGGVLAFCLGQKRWRVNYGSDMKRVPVTKLSVPYRAKDNPSLRSEFSHPDVVVILTCFNYYYTGLDNNDLFLAFNHLVKSDQADMEYQLWVDDAQMLPYEYHQLVGLNLEDQNHCINHVFPALRSAKAAIDYFLDKFVFAREMKEFPDKLSASGWDIGEIKTNPTVGFSGTNDSRKLLPLSVKQLDLPKQNHTNALVLKHLLQPENSVAFIPCQQEPLQTDAKHLLDLVMNLSPPAQVILDVGAQILELGNSEVAAHWLGMLPKQGPIQAVVFVNDEDRICVIDRKGRVEPLQVSPFARQLQACFVFLDEAHTRGIDLKLPTTYRAAVTVGPHITKDKLVQACMRMRKLGNGQSVVFCIPAEIKHRILALSGKKQETEIDVSDVITWAVSETWADIRRSMPLWAVQGTRFERQKELWQTGCDENRIEMTMGQAQRFLEPESQTLERRYRPGHQQNSIINSVPGENLNLHRIVDRCREFQTLNFTSSTLQEEQERELAPEIESEREIQRPPEAVPEAHQIHPHLRDFVTTGSIKRSSDAFRPAFHSLRNTSAASFLDLTQFPSDLLVTKDFATTVKVPVGSKFTADAFQRPVRWVLSTGGCLHHFDEHTITAMIIISPYEANCLIPEIRKSGMVTLHSYGPRQNRGFSSLDHLTMYNVPEHPRNLLVPDTLRIQLNLFSGQLYLESFLEYEKLCEFLGVASVKAPEGYTVAPDGFIEQDDQGRGSRFHQSPLKFLREFISQTRKDCQDIGRTHVGRILNGQLVNRSDFLETGAEGDEGLSVDSQ